MSAAVSDSYGLRAEFSSSHDIFKAATKIREAGFKSWDCYTPFPVHGLEKAMGMPRSKVPVVVLIGGITGFCTGMAITWYMNGFDYPLVIGGKPYWSPIYPFPVFYELTILFSAFGAFFGQFLLNLLPQHYHPVFNSEQFERASDNAFFIVIEARDPQYARAREFLQSVGGFNITPVGK